MKLTLDEARQKAKFYMEKGYHCGPAVLQVMWEAYGLEDENFLWASIPFLGGVSGNNKATCGAVSGAGIAVGLRHRTGFDNNDKAKTARNRIRKDAADMASEFSSKFGHLTCKDLLDIDFSVPGNYKKFKESGIGESKCFQYVYFVIEKLFAMEENRAAERGI